MLKLLALLALLLADPALAAPGDQSIGQVPVVSASAEASHVLKATPGNLISVYFTNTTGGANGFLVVLNATSAPVDGAITPQDCVFVPSGQTAGLNWTGSGDAFTTGITAVFTTAATCFTKTTGVVTGFFHAQVQ